MTVQARIAIERFIVGKLVDRILAEGYRIEAYDSVYRDGSAPVDSKDVSKKRLLEEIFAGDDAFLTVRMAAGKGWEGWIKLIYGNDGWDVISDYTTNLEELLKPVNEFADKISKGKYTLTVEA